jgi:hypothetical protein
MRNRKFIVFIIIIIVIISGSIYLSVGKSVNYLEYFKSLQTWNTLKKENNNSYSYISSYQSWTGNYSNTKIEVKNGIPISRNYETGVMEYNISDNNKVDIKNTKNDTYSENQSNLGTHKSGFSAITIDDIYKKCITSMLKVSILNNTINFELDKNGLISSCGYTPKNCQDDCFRGIEISNFQWIK